MYICTELYYICDITNYHKFSGIRPHTFTILLLGRSEVSFSGLKSKCQQSCIPFGESIPCFFQLLHLFPIGPHHSTLHYHHSSYFLPWLSFKDLSDYTGLIQMCVLSRFSRVWLFTSLWTVACQAPLSKGSSRQEYWSGLPHPPPGDLPNPGIKPASLMSPALGGRFFTTCTTWEAQIITQIIQHNLLYPHSLTPAKPFLPQKVLLTGSGHQNMNTFWGGNHHSAYLTITAFNCIANGQWLTASYNKPSSMWS